MGLLAFAAHHGAETGRDAEETACHYFPTSRKSSDTDAAYFARRSNEAARRAKYCGEWSKIWANDILKWDAHVSRQHDTGSWNYAALKYKGQSWLDLRRSVFSSFLESRTRSRAGIGGVSKRWNDSRADARNYL